MTTTWVKIDEIKQRVNLQMLFNHYGLIGKGEGTEVRLQCPFHDDEHPSLSANLTKGAWQCFGCGAKGDTIAFVVLMEKIKTGNRNRDRREAALYLANVFGIESTRPRRGKPAQRAAVAEESTPPGDDEVQSEDTAGKEDGDTPGNPPLTFSLKNLNPYHPYLANRGLTDETIATFGLGHHAGKGSMQGRIAIPIHNEHGELIAYAGRWPGDEGSPEGEVKYKFPPNFHKSLVLYNLHRAKEHASDGLIVVEGFFTVFDLWQRKRRNAVAIMGSHLSAEQEKLVVQTVGPKGRVLLAFDADAAGRKGMQDAAARLASQVFVRTIELNM